MPGVIIMGGPLGIMPPPPKACCGCIAAGPAVSARLPKPGIIPPMAGFTM
eukprot:CAMPEP_0170430066 /NCGR_PEP_ID=MMETSP0117_2-20130122/40655_1 /TAXON_ID=400756 /ORGANISM="Durinskia baltica, Strain CSIRO CS-38" /LENGTH=49 /DNA_ID=CAMNT_0010689501 /DNA_START=114 /DNA_END=263 /DNA_ORIENTATION=+